MNNSLFFQYCQKIILFNETKDAVLLAKRKGEADYDGVYSFIGGKMETTDGGFVEGLKREKDEEVGAAVKMTVCPSVSYNAYFTRKMVALWCCHITTPFTKAVISRLVTSMPTTNG